MRSRLEAGYAQFLDARGIAWKYEPECFADETGQYLPDFRLGNNIYVEVKPDSFTDLDKLFGRMHLIRTTVPDAVLTIAVGRWDGVYKFNPARTCAGKCETCNPPMEKFDYLNDACIGQVYLTCTGQRGGDAGYGGVLTARLAPGGFSESEDDEFHIRVTGDAEMRNAYRGFKLITRWMEELGFAWTDEDESNYLS